MLKSTLSSWSIPKLWFKFIFVFDIYIHKHFVLLETQLILLPSVTTFPCSTAGPPLHHYPQTSGTLQIQHGGFSSPPTSSSLLPGCWCCWSCWSCWCCCSVASAFLCFHSLLRMNAVCCWARADYHSSDFGQCRCFQRALLSL